MIKIWYCGLLFLLCLSGCASILQGSGTVIGPKVGFPDGLNFVIGFQRYDFVKCEHNADVDVSLQGTVTATGIKGKQHARFGRGVNVIEEPETQEKGEVP